MRLLPKGPIAKRVVVYGGFLGALAFSLWFNCRCPGTTTRTLAPQAVDPFRMRLESSVTHMATTLGERNVQNAPQALEATADWIMKEWRDLGLQPREFTYRASEKGHLCRNLEVDVAGPDGAPIVLIGAHYDSAHGTPGADDNASGVAAMLEISRALAGERLPALVRCVAFVNEEPPWFYGELMGSYVYAKMAKERQDPIYAMISLETMAYFTDRRDSQAYPRPLSLLYPDQGNFIGVIGCLSGRWLVTRTVELLRVESDVPVECASLWHKTPGVSLSDHSSFWKVGYPAIMITDTANFRNPGYHQYHDLPDRLDYDRFARVVMGVIAVTRQLARDAGEERK
jgi:hypothetical protein